MNKVNEINGLEVGVVPTPKALQNTTIGSIRVPTLRCDGALSTGNHIAVVCDVLERALENVYRNHPETRAAVAADWDAANLNFANETTAVICAEPVHKGGA